MVKYYMFLAIFNLYITIVMLINKESTAIVMYSSNVALLSACLAAERHRANKIVKEYMTEK